MAGFIQQVFNESKIKVPYFSLICIVVIGIFEFESIINHWLVLHNRKPIDFTRFLTIFAKKKDETLGEIAEEYENEQKHSKKKHTKKDK